MPKKSLALALLALAASLSGEAFSAPCQNTGSYERWL